MLRRYNSVAVLVGISLASIAACSQRVVIADGAPASANGFGSADSGSDSGDTDASLPEDVLMCPVTTCTFPWTTCPSSEFPCSTNLLSDDENCGGCGIRCPGSNAQTNSNWLCVNGQCSLVCTNSARGDCDGDPTNGCETLVGTDRDCGACGNKCPPGWRCDLSQVCVDPCVVDGLPDRCGLFKCVDFASDDENCGACDNVCDSVEPTLPPLPADMQYGCGGGNCGVPKCKDKDKRNCNGDLEDGCETTVHTNENCARCNDTCPAGTSCRVYPNTLNTYACLDPPPPCGSRDELTDCGTCGFRCPGIDTPHFNATCKVGICGGECAYGYADCNGSLDDGCEVNTQVDNRNCGACGSACLPNQVCFQGKCQVTPCDAGLPGAPTK